MITVLGVDGHIEDVLEKGSAVGLGDLSPLAVFIKRDRTREVGTLESWLFAAGAEIEFAACGGEAVDVIVGGGTLGCMALGGSAVGRVPVKTSEPIPKERIFDVMAEIQRQKAAAPVDCGQVLIKNILGLGADLVATRTIRS